MTDPVLDTFRKLKDKHDTPLSAANEALQCFPNDVESIQALQRRTGAQLAGLLNGLMEYGIIDSDQFDNLLLAMMRETWDKAR